MTSTPKPSARKSPARKTADKANKNPELDALEALARKVDADAEDDLIRNTWQPGRVRGAPEDGMGLRIQQTRESMRLTQGDLAVLSKSVDAEDRGISRAVISLYEAGKNRPSPREIRLLCESLKVTPNFLIYGDEHPFDALADYERLGTIARNDPEGFAWMAYVMKTSHHNHYDAVMKLVLDLARGWNKAFDQGLQEKANENLLEMADELRTRLDKRKRLKR